MPEVKVGSKKMKFPYTEKGMMEAKEYREKGKKMMKSEKKMGKKR